MLVLTRKTDEQIMIGDDIRITLVRVRGNSVRIGIEAPREIRIIRGELDSVDGPDAGGKPLHEREEAFANPSPPLVATGRTAVKGGSETVRFGSSDSCGELATAAKPAQIFSGRVVRAAADSARQRRAPLSGFMSAS